MIIIHDMKRIGYRPRALAPAIEAALQHHPVVILTGARQTGKSTLVQNLPSAGGRTFLTLDDLEVLDAVNKRPDELLAAGRRLTFDEVQKAPNLLLAIKRDVDRRRVRGRFLLTGSANLLLMRQASDSLAGRAVYLYLAPFTSGERTGTGAVPGWSEILSCRRAEDAASLVRSLGTTSKSWERDLLLGGMPRAALARTNQERLLWFEGYVRTYLERDLRELADVSSLPDFRRLMGLAAQRIGQLLNQTEIGRDAGVAQATAHRYLNILEITFQTYRVPAYSVSLSRRLIKAPKLYWGDTGIAAFLAGLATVNDLRQSRLAGALLENHVLAALRAWRETYHPRPEVTFWRTAAGVEVDFVVEAGARLLPIEVKTAARVHLDDLRGLEEFLEEHREHAPFGMVLHGGKEASLPTTRIVAAPVSLFF
jgi:predicted AAA+ superfamily ATPase